MAQGQPAAADDGPEGPSADAAALTHGQAPATQDGEATAAASEPPATDAGSGGGQVLQAAGGAADPAVENGTAGSAASVPPNTGVDGAADAGTHASGAAPVATEEKAAATLAAVATPPLTPTTAATTTSAAPPAAQQSAVNHGSTPGSQQDATPTGLKPVPQVKGPTSIPPDVDNNAADVRDKDTQRRRSGSRGRSRDEQRKESPPPRDRPRDRQRAGRGRNDRDQPNESNRRDGPARETPRKHPQNSRLFLGNLACERVSKEELSKMFSKYGIVREISLKKSFGFIQYDNPKSAQLAMEAETGRNISGLKLDISYATKQGSKEDKRRQNDKEAAKSPPAKRRGLGPGGRDVRPDKNALVGGGFVRNVRNDRMSAAQRDNNDDYDRGRKRLRTDLDGRRNEDSIDARRGGVPLPRPSTGGSTAAKDCEIIITSTNADEKEFADQVGRSLAETGLKVGLTVLRPENNVGNVLRDMALSGVSYACVVDPMRSLRGTVTIKFLAKGPGTPDMREVFLSEAVGILQRDFARPAEVRPASGHSDRGSLHALDVRRDNPRELVPPRRDNAPQVLANEIYSILGDSSAPARGSSAAAGRAATGSAYSPSRDGRVQQRVSHDDRYAGNSRHHSPGRDAGRHGTGGAYGGDSYSSRASTGAYSSSVEPGGHAAIDMNSRHGSGRRNDGRPAIDPLISARAGRVAVDPLISARDGRAAVDPLISARDGRAGLDPFGSTRDGRAGADPFARDGRAGADSFGSTRGARATDLHSVRGARAGDTLIDPLISARNAMGKRGGFNDFQDDPGHRASLQRDFDGAQVGGRASRSEPHDSRNVHPRAPVHNAPNRTEARSQDGYSDFSTQQPLYETTQRTQSAPYTPRGQPGLPPQHGVPGPVLGQEGHLRGSAAGHTPPGQFAGGGSSAGGAGLYRAGAQTLPPSRSDTLPRAHQAQHDQQAHAVRTVTTLDDHGGFGGRDRNSRDSREAPLQYDHHSRQQPPARGSVRDGGRAHGSHALAPAPGGYDGGRMVGSHAPAPAPGGYPPHQRATDSHAPYGQHAPPSHVGLRQTRADNSGGGHDYNPQPALDDRELYKALDDLASMPGVKETLINMVSKPGNR